VNIIIRKYQQSDPISDITALLHSAYSALAKQGMKFLASHQDDKITKSRLEKGTAFLLIHDNKIIGTISVHKPAEDTTVEFNRREGVYTFSQYAIDPAFQGKGFGKMLFKAAEDYCRSINCKAVTLDTSEKATDLIKRYQNWGFEIIDQIQWDVTNYKSVVMAKLL